MPKKKAKKAKRWTAKQMQAKGAKRSREGYMTKVSPERRKEIARAAAAARWGKAAPK